MGSRSFEIRECQSADCRLRYPLVDAQPFGSRCPRCLGDTLVVLMRDIPTAETIQSAPVRGSLRLEAVLDNLRSAWNVGSIFRTAEGFGLDHIYLAGFTPTPDGNDVQKTSLGAESRISWSLHRNGLDLVSSLKTRGQVIWALENEKDALPLVFNPSAEPLPIVLVVGNEVTGIDPAILDIADRTFRLPMRGWKTSFNVAIAFALAAYSLMTQQSSEGSRLR